MRTPCVATLLALATPSWAADLYVCATPGVCSLDAECTANPAVCFDTVTGAIGAAQDGDEIWLSAETYAESITNDGGPSPLTLIGDGAGGTVIDGTATGEAVDFKDVDMTLRDLKITVSAVANRRCVRSDDGSLNLDGVTIEGCVKDKGAGLEAKNSAVVTITDSTFLDNEADGNAKGGGHILVSSDASVIISGSSFMLGEATGNNSIGGAIQVESGTVDIAGSWFSDNTSTGGGGAIYVQGNGAATLTLCDLEANTSALGGAIRSDGTVSVVMSTLTSNIADDGGALYCGVGASCTVTSSMVEQNTASRGGARLAGLHDAEVDKVHRCSTIVVGLLRRTERKGCVSRAQSARALQLRGEARCTCGEKEAAFPVAARAAVFIARCST